MACGTSMLPQVKLTAADIWVCFEDSRVTRESMLQERAWRLHSKEHKSVLQEWPQRLHSKVGLRDFTARFDITSLCCKSGLLDGTARNASPCCKSGPRDGTARFDITSPCRKSGLKATQQGAQVHVARAASKTLHSAKGASQGIRCAGGVLSKVSGL